MVEESGKSPATGLIVLGMHRSGTSALTGALGLCGARLGETQELTDPNFENSKGFWERRDVRRICDHLLFSAGADWWKVAAFEAGAIPHATINEHGRAFQAIVAQLGAQGVWAIKEPRLCLLFQILRPFIAHSVCIHVYRNPLEVALSLRARNGFGVAEGLALWEIYNREALRASSGLPRLLASYEMLVSEPEETLRRLLCGLSSLGISDLTLPTTKDLEAFIAPSLRHQTNETAETIEFLLPSQHELWSQLQSGAALDAHSPDGLSHVAHQYLLDLESRKGSIEQLVAKAKRSDTDAKKLASKIQQQKAQLQAQKARQDDLTAKLEASNARARALDELKRKAEQAGASLEAQLAAMYTSHSWRITAPLRAVSLFMKRTLRISQNVFRLLWWLGTGQFTRAAKAIHPRYQRYVPSRIKGMIPRRIREVARSRLQAEGAGPFPPNQHGEVASSNMNRDDVTKNVGLASILSSKVARSRFGQELQRIVEQEASQAFADALRESESQLALMIARLQSLDDRPLVSIVMPTHNRAQIIGGAITTVLEQQYHNWELLVCDDGSTDDTEAVMAKFLDCRIRYLDLSKQGAAAARNAGLRAAQGSIVAYLDSDNFWHPAFLSALVLAFIENPSIYAAYTDFIDFQVDKNGIRFIKSFRRLPFDQERLLHKPFIDLNSFAHKRELYDCFGGFDERLKRRQDYDLMLKYTWLKDPLHISCLTTLYQRNDSLSQITQIQREDRSCISIIDRSVKGYFARGLPGQGRRLVENVTILSPDTCGDCFSKAVALAEALSNQYNVQLIAFRFSDEKIPPLLQDFVPTFETLYLPGSHFPDFFDSMRQALAANRGDIIYVLEPRLASLGLALLANCQRGTPIILEINNPHTTASSQEAIRKLADTGIAVDLDSDELLDPDGELWSQFMHTSARQMPDRVTESALDSGSDRRCFDIRNVNDEKVYDPAAYDRNLVRRGLGFTAEDRVILFSHLLPKQENFDEIFKLFKYLGNQHYKLLFVDSRPSSNYKKLHKQYGERVHVLSPQNHKALARITYAADLVVLWPDPCDRLNHHQQMPDELVNALAMGRPVIVNDSSDCRLLIKQGYVRPARVGDWGTLARLIQESFDNPDEVVRNGQIGRRLFLRQFSFAAARSNFALAVRRTLAQGSDSLPAAKAFGDRFNHFYRRASPADCDFIQLEKSADRRKSSTAREIHGYSEAEEDGSIVVVDGKDLAMLSHRDPAGVAVIMPSTDAQKALNNARVLVKRAGMKVTVFIVNDTLRQGFVRVINDAADRLKVAYVVFVADSAFPGVHWLRIAYEALERTGKGLLAFNDGKRHGRFAAFGMVCTRWVKDVYGGPILFPGYREHEAACELTVIARTMNALIYEPTATLVEVDLAEVLEGGEGLNQRKDTADYKLMYERFHHAFDSRFSSQEIAPYKDECLNPAKRRATWGATFKPAEDSIQHVEIGNVQSISCQNQDEIAVIMPCVNPAAGHATAKLLVQRAGIAARVYVVEDTLRQGFIRTLNETAAQLKTKYIVYLAEDAFPGVNWLRTAHARLEETGKALLAFNCGKWHGRVAAFGMVRTDWVRTVYGPGVLLHSGYKAHKADNELTVIARVLQQFVYEPESILIENDSKKIFKENVPEDKATFHRRFRTGFDRLVTLEQLKPLAEAYFVPLNPKPGSSESFDRGKDDNALDGDFKASRIPATAVPAPHRPSRAGEALASELKGASGSSLMSLRPAILEQEERYASDPPLSRVLRTLKTSAEHALERCPYSVADKTSLPPSGDRQDYWHPAPYWWPDPRKPDGLPYVRKDGERVPGTQMYDPESEKYDRTRLQRVFDDSLTLALAWCFFKDARYAEAGARICERFFVNTETGMKPHLRFAQVRMGHRNNEGSPAGLIEAKDMYFYLDAVRLFQNAGVISDAVAQRFCSWLGMYLKWLLTSDQGNSERTASNNHGTCYDLQVAAIASFLGDKKIVHDTLARAQARISEQFTPEGNQPHEIKRKATAHYCCFNLQSWINLAELSSRWGVNLWEYETPTGAGLKNAARWLISTMDKPWPYEQIDKFDSERFLPIWFAASEHLDLGSLNNSATKSQPSVYAVKAVFFPHDGIRPFWNLASYAVPAASGKQPAAKGPEASFAGR